MFISLKIYNEKKKPKTNSNGSFTLCNETANLGFIKKKNINLVCIRRHIIPSRHLTTLNSELKRRQEAHNTTGHNQTSLIFFKCNFYLKLSYPSM